MTSLNILPDDVLLDIFDFCSYQDPYDSKQKSSGSHWRTCVSGGEALFLDLHVASICTLFAHPEHP